MKIGIGYDIHRLVKGRKLILGGVEIPFKLGLEGHSDGDTLLHAISDAFLGAASLGDIGHHFPDNDEKYKNISSLLILKEVGEKIKDKGLEVENIDSTLILEEPKVSSYMAKMKDNIAETLTISQDKINIKATTQEKLGFLGKGEGIAAFAVVLLKER